MFFIVWKKLPVLGLTIWPFILVPDLKLIQDPILINHERIHLRQQLELLIIPFYLLYGLNWLFNLVKYRSGEMAYRQIIFEREAYAQEKNLNYLSQRKWGSFLRYWKKTQK